MKTYSFHAPTPQGTAGAHQQAFLIGVDFHEAAIRAGTEVRDPSGVPVVALCPMIVCYAFAAALYIKSMLAGTRRNHRLNVLFGNLPADVQADIAKRYRTRTGRGRSLLDEDLRSLATAFVEWRYVFEGEGQQLHLNLLIAFTRAALEVIRARHPEWPMRHYHAERLRADEESPSMTVANLGGGIFVHLIDGTGGTLNTAKA
jgi:hypothetical protein